MVDAAALMQIKRATRQIDRRPIAIGRRRNWRSEDARDCPSSPSDLGSPPNALCQAERESGAAGRPQ
jgi:hypothetical protein